MYKLMKLPDDSVEEYGIKRLSDGAGIPRSKDNRDYVQFLQDIKDNDISIVEGADIIEPDYVALRTGDDGYATSGEQLDMQYKDDGSWEAHIKDIKDKFPKSNTGSTTVENIPDWVQEDVDSL